MNHSSLHSLLAAALVAVAVPACAPQHGPAGPTTRQIEASQAMLEPLPAPARMAADREIEGGLVRHVTTGEFEGNTLYTIDFTTPAGENGRLQTLSDGRILGRRVDRQMFASGAGLPAAVQQSADSHTGNAKLTSAMKESWNGRDVYVCTAVLSGRSHELTFDERGTLLKEQQEIPYSQVPAVVQAAILTRFPDLNGKASSEIRVGSMHYYEVVGQHMRQRTTLTLAPDGTYKSIRMD